MAASALVTGPTTGTTHAGNQHPLYTYFAQKWLTLAHAVEGIGGFGDGTYLIGHPREYLDHDQDAPKKPTAKLKERRRLARYENWPLTLLTLLSGALFRASATRRAGDPEDTVTHPLAEWWDDVDGLGTPIDVFMQRQWAAAATFGHVFLVMDRPPAEAATRADAPRLYLRAYTPLDVPDWVLDEMGGLASIALAEAAPRRTLGEAVTERMYTRHLTADGYVLAGAETVVAASGLPRTGPSAIPGVLPVVVLYARRRPLVPLLGQSVLGDPQLYVDDYNLTSEVRELLRKQTFSVINIPLGTGDAAQSLADAQALLGNTTGTTNVLFSAQAAQILSPDTSNVDVYQAERQELRRSMFRASGVPWEGDSKDAESAESRKIKREDLNQTLALFAGELEQADRMIARLWMQAEHGDGWQAAWDAANVTIAYPRSFDADDLDTLIARAQLAIGLGLGETATARLKAKVVQQLLPNQTPDDEQQMVREIEDAAAKDSAHEATMREAREAALAAGPRAAAPVPDDTPDDTDEDGQ